MAVHRSCCLQSQHPHQGFALIGPGAARYGSKQARDGSQRTAADGSYSSMEFHAWKQTCRALTARDISC
eukprot:1145847-Pelagomonas_calceolata.AAC.4